MKFKIPLPLQQEHEALHERLRLATQAGGEVGEAAETLAQLMHPHFIKEHQGIVAALKRCVMPQRKRAAATSSTMQTPAFFDAVPAIFVVDPLADALGAVEGGLIEYRYIDAVKLAGHSCPTVAGAWLMTRAALARLDSGQSVELSHRPQVVPRPAALGELLSDALAPGADAAARRAFADTWQGWVSALVIDHAGDPALIATT